MEIKNKYLFLGLIILIIIFILLEFSFKEHAQLQDPDIKILFDDKKSKFQNIKVAEVDKLGKCLFIDGELQLSTKDEHIYHDMIVHFPAQYVPNFKKVLIVGGGDLMALREVMKYPSIKEVIILELDPVIVKTCNKFFGINTFKDDPRVKIIYGDASQTIDKLRSQKNSFDMCIVDSTEDGSQNLPIDRKEFFQKCANLLTDQGVLVKNGEKFTQLLNTIFPDSIVYGAHINAFDSIYKFTVCSKKKNMYNAQIYPEKWNNLNINAKFYNVDKHFDYIVFNYGSYIS